MASLTFVSTFDETAFVVPEVRIVRDAQCYTAKLVNILAQGSFLSAFRCTFEHSLSFHLRYQIFDASEKGYTPSRGKSIGLRNIVELITKSICG